MNRNNLRSCVLSIPAALVRGAVPSVDVKRGAFIPYSVLTEVSQQSYMIISTPMLNAESTIGVYCQNYLENTNTE